MLAACGSSEVVSIERAQRRVLASAGAAKSASACSAMAANAAAAQARLKLTTPCPKTASRF